MPDTSVATPEHIDGVLVVGAGYAGLHAARQAGGAGVPVTVVSPSASHDFVTRLAAIAGGTETIDRASTQLSEFPFTARLGSVASVGNGAVELSDGSALTADAVVLTAGAQPTAPPIEGIEHALTLRTAPDAVALRSSVASAAALIIIGAGPTGVQLAGAAASVHTDLDVHLVESSDRLLSSMSPALSDGAARILGDRGVTVHLGIEVSEISSTGVSIGDDEWLEGLVVWAGGFEARSDGLGLDANDEGRVLVDDQLRVMGMTSTFAAGDIAAHLRQDGTRMPMSAQIAVQAGSTAGANAARVIADEPLESASLVQRGWVLDLGGNRGLAEFGPVTLSRPFLDVLPPLLHTAIDVKTLFGIGGVSSVRRNGF